MSYRTHLSPVCQGNQSMNFNKEKIEAAWVFSWFPFLEWIDWFPETERHFDGILVANTETWTRIFWRKNVYQNEMPTKIQSLG